MDEKEYPQNLEDCHKLIKQLLEVTQTLVIRIEKLEEENKALKERLNNNSSNSSQPPSTDKRKKKQSNASKNKGGGKMGHKGHFRKLLDVNEVDDIVKCRLPSHCECGGRINLKEEHHRHQVYELPKIRLHVTEYHLEKGRCTCCGANPIAILPEGVTWGITGPNLTSFMSQMVSKYKLSRRELQEFLKEQYSFTLSLGSVFNKQKLVNKALEKPTSELLEQIKESPCVNMDETGHRRDGKSEWLWGMMSQKAAFFSIEKSRGKKIIHRLMEGYEYIIISDRYAGYNYFDSSKRQLCWAHLKRDFTKISEKPDKTIARIGKNLLSCQAKIFEYWHRYKQGHLCRNSLALETELIRKQMGEYLEQGSYTDPKLKIVRFCKNLLDNFSALWTFIFVDGVEPTNNHAERCLRPAVIWRKKSFGTRSDYGSEFVARTMSFITTCKLQSKNSFELLKETMHCFFSNIKAPSLI
jgi:transposase